MTDIRVQFEMVKAMSFTESLLYTAGQVFGAKRPETDDNLTCMGDMLALAKMVNG